MSAYLQGIVDRVRQVAEPLVQHAGMELVDLEYLREGSRWVLRFYIDSPGGVGLDECQTISRLVGPALDVEDFIEQAYDLEVSSPGLERPLKKREHFERYAGKAAVVKTFGPIGVPPRKNFKGTLLGVAGEEVRIEADGSEFRIPLEQIAKAHLAYEPGRIPDVRGKDTADP